MKHLRQSITFWKTEKMFTAFGILVLIVKQYIKTFLSHANFDGTTHEYRTKTVVR